MRYIAAILVALVSVLAHEAQAQDYRMEVGPALGMSGYLGDANRSNFMRNPGYTAGAVFRYLPSTRWALKANLLTAHISGNSANESNVLAGGETYSFTSQLYDLGVQAEFNFLNFGIGSKYMKLKRISPYMVLGVGVTLGCPNEGGTAVTMNIPLGVGVKYKLRERLNLGLEFTMRKALGDGLDGLSDLNGIKHGFAKNTDWYSMLMFTVTYEFSKRCKICHYVD